MLVADGRLEARRRRLRPDRRPDVARDPGDADRPDRGPARRPRPADRGLLLDAAVLGQSFTLAGLAAVSGLGRGGARAAAALARRGGRSSPVDLDPRSPERGQYAFVQALIREVAYNTLSRATAAATSRRRGSSSRSARRSWPGALAGHYLAATRTRPRAPRPMRSPPRRGSRCGRPPIAPRARRRTPRRSPSWTRRSGHDRPGRARRHCSSEPASRRPRMSAHDDAVARITRAAEAPGDAGGPACRGPNRRGPGRMLLNGKRVDAARAHLEQATAGSPTSTAPRSSP